MGRSDPHGGHRFKVEIDGLVVAHFQGIGGLGAEAEVLAYQEGGKNDGLLKLPGQGQLGQITLRRGWATDTGLWTWMKEARELGASRLVVRKTVDVVVLREDGSESGRYTLDRAWPAKWTTQDFESGGGAAIETLELVHEGLRHTPGAPANRGPGQDAARQALDRRLDAANAAGAGRSPRERMAAAADAARGAAGGLRDAAARM